MKHYLFFVILSGISLTTAAQLSIDSIQPINEVIIRSYFSEQPVFSSPVSVSIIESNTLRLQPSGSLVSTVNTAPGVRMEERSPGSYRLSIRGSLLRSPFGIRNVKIYMDEFPLTDAGGNTYLNLLDVSAVNRMEILKGPNASIFGANSGGVIRINPFIRANDSTLASVSGSAGSYGLIHGTLSAGKQWKKYKIRLNQAWQHADGYRENSALNRNYTQISQQWNYSPSAQLRSVIFYSDLAYQTPGGLTAQQMQQNPRAARPRSGNVPGATEQQAGIENQTLFAGLLNEWQLNHRTKQVLAIFGSHTDFKNPFITNYEMRDEQNIGIRTYFELSSSPGISNWKWQTGIESAQAVSEIFNYDNEAGTKGAMQSADKLRATESFAFTRFAAGIANWHIEAAASLNHFGYRYKSLTGNNLSGKKKLRMELMPRLAVSYAVNDYLSWRSSASRGYSPPTIAEVRSSDKVINTSLQAENGWNFETGMRFRSLDDRFYADMAIFNYRLQDAIVRRVDQNDAEYFINAGGTRQPGLELEAMYWVIRPSSGGFIQGVQLKNSYTHNRFSFIRYRNAAADYSGNRLTGVPEHTLVSNIYVRLPQNTYIFGQYNFTSEIPLNDANNVYAQPYHLAQLKAGWQSQGDKKISIKLFGGVDNLFNTNYSLGNDLNAFGERYFNPSPPRNFYAGFGLGWK